ncbi:hypothetical protein FDECE_1442 [Fusarium decemcellulare]|nr:hypothetical protein FDECE_1442 [Fusarium decemcellulare]
MADLAADNSQSRIPLLPYPSPESDPLPSPSPDNPRLSSEDDRSSTGGRSVDRSHASLLYESLPLSSATAVRVLDLQDCAGLEDGPVIATMRVVDLDTRPFFTALSYVWGEWSTPKDVISCNGYEIPVTKNCLAALRQLNRFGPITIWVDAICINQEDNQEKNTQIPLMGTIYSSLGAHTIYVWLGEGTKDTDKAMDYFARGCLPFSFLISQKCDDGQAWGGGIPTGMSMSLRLGWYLYLRFFTGRLTPHEKGIEELLNRPWINRLWTLQEAMLSDKLVLVCGARAIPLHALLYSVEFMQFFRRKVFGLRFPTSLHRWHRLIVIWTDFFYSNVTIHENDQSVLQELKSHKKYLQKGWLVFQILAFLHLTALFCALLYCVISAAVADFTKYKQGLKRVPPPGIWGYVFWLLFLLLGPLLIFLRSLRGQFQRLYPYREAEALLLEIRERESLYAKDKYYATSSLLKRGYEIPEWSSTSKATAYRYLSRDLVRHTQSLDVLLFTAYFKVGRSPSWVVNWRCATSAWLHTLYFYGSAQNKWLSWVPNGEKTTLYRYPGATPVSEGLCSFLNEKQLVVEGAIISDLNFVSESLGHLTDSSSKDEIAGNLSIILEAASRIEQTYYSECPDIRLSRKLWHLIPFVIDRGRFEGESGIRYKWCKLVEKGISRGMEWTLKELQAGPWVPFIWPWQRRRRLRPLSKRVRTVWDFQVALTNYLNSKKMALGVCEALGYSRSPYSDLETFIVDYTDVNKLVQQLAQLRIKVVISALSIHNEASGKAHLNLIEAARRSSFVKRFIPSEYGGIDYAPDPARISHIPPYLFKVEAAKALEASYLEYARISNGLLLDYWSAPRIPTYLRQLFVMWVDFANNFAALPGDGSATIVVTHSRDVGRAVARLLNLAPWESRYCVIGDRLTMNQIIQMAQEIKGQKFQVQYDSAEDLQNGHITLTPRLRAYADEQDEETRRQLMKI